MREIRVNDAPRDARPQRVGRRVMKSGRIVTTTDAKMNSARPVSRDKNFPATVRRLIPISFAGRAAPARACP
jgi:hypothetical protein